MDVIHNSPSDTEHFFNAASGNITTSITSLLPSHPEKAPDWLKSPVPSVEADTKEPYELGDKDNDPHKVYIHFRELPKDAVRRDHVVAILGPESAKGEDAIALKTAEIERLKTELRSWANEHIKRLVLSNAKDLNLKIGGKKPVNSWLDIGKWWCSCTRGDKRAQDTMSYIVYSGWFKKVKLWTVQLERKFMEENHLAYSTSSLAAAQANCQKEGVALKGCIAQTIAYVKCDVVKQLQRVGKKAAHGMVITKSRPAEQTRDADGKYVKRNPEEYCITIYTDDEEGDDEGESKPTKIMDSKVNAFFIFVRHADVVVLELSPNGNSLRKYPISYVQVAISSPFEALDAATVSETCHFSDGSETEQEVQNKKSGTQRKQVTFIVCAIIKRRKYPSIILVSHCSPFRTRTLIHNSQELKSHAIIQTLSLADDVHFDMGPDELDEVNVNDVCSDVLGDKPSKKRPAPKVNTGPEKRQVQCHFCFQFSNHFMLDCNLLLSFVANK